MTLRHYTYQCGCTGPYTPSMTPVKDTDTKSHEFERQSVVTSQPTITTPEAIKAKGIQSKTGGVMDEVEAMEVD